MANQVIAIVPSKERHVFISGKGVTKNFEEPAAARQWLESQCNGSKPTVLTIMGGPCQEFFSRLVDMGIVVNRVPIYRLQEELDIEPKSSSEDRASALILMWEKSKESFYPMEQPDQAIGFIRELTRERLNIQEERKRAMLRLHGTLRSLEDASPKELATVINLLDKSLKKLFKKPELQAEIEEEFRRLDKEVKLSDFYRAQVFTIRRIFSNPRRILGAKEDEQDIEKEITRYFKDVEIWRWINPGKNSGLPAIKGFGPSIGGSVISEIGDIRRFPTPEDLRAYARFHVNTEGKFPHRKAGEVSPFNRYLSRAIWLWSSDQVARYDHIWKLLYLWKKARELQAHPEPLPREVARKGGGATTVYDFTLKHIDSRAKRWTGSQLLNYLWALWQEVAKGNNPEVWYPKSSWPAYFAKVKQELDGGLLAYLEAEIPKRRRQEPKTGEEEGED